jgi:hypothetical protein
MEVPDMLKWLMVLLLVFAAVSSAEAKEMGGKPLPFPLGADISDRFVGTVHRNDLIDTVDVYKLPQTNVISLACFKNVKISFKTNLKKIC